MSPSPEWSELRFSTPERDSAVAQRLADEEGPRVKIGAEVTWVGDSRRVRARFNLQDDAYVMVGHIDPNGVVRVVFPTDPKDDGFVRGGDRRYETDEVFAGFASEYQFRYQQARNYTTGNQPYSYDRGIGYMFVIASWRPLHFDKLSSGPEAWDSYEIADDSYLRDPRPAIYELASLLSGENREAYTVEFASYFNTTTYGGASSYSAFSSGFNSGFCAGYGLSGFGFSPFDSPLFGSLFSYGESFYYRGSYYAYNYGSGCYSAGSAFYNPFGYGFGRIAQGPFVPPVGFGLASAYGHRTPFTPRPVTPVTGIKPGISQTTGQHQARIAAADAPHFNPEYRHRGLFTNEDPNAKPGENSHTTPRIDGRADGFHGRPAIQEMVGRRASEQNETRDWSRGEHSVPSHDGATIRQGFSQSQSGMNTGRTERSGGNWSGNARSNGGNAGNSSWDSGQRMRSAGDVPRSSPRAEPMQQPHSFSPAPAASAPRAAVSAPAARSEPPAASSSSSGKPKG